MSLRIISVGKDHDSYIREGVERFNSRCKKPFDIKWELIAPSPYDSLGASQDESQRILTRLEPRDYAVLLDERGDMLSSPALSQLIDRQLTAGRSLTFIIGGAYGVDDTIHQRADKVWSLSDLVLPHQLVRLVLSEQLYRAQEIQRGGKYHHI